MRMWCTATSSPKTCSCQQMVRSARLLRCLPLPRRCCPPSCCRALLPTFHCVPCLHPAAALVPTQPHCPSRPSPPFSDELLVGDFGLAIQQQQELPFLRAGTLDYMSPEVSEAAGLSCR